jgi:ferredoxin
MNPSAPIFGEKGFVRALDRAFSRLEGLLNRLVTERYNPLYHLGTLAIFLLALISVTGIYLTIFYRPGTEAGYATVESISSNWFGLMMRSIHRYASDAFMVVILLHALKSLASGRFWGSRWLAWVSGWGMVVLTWLTGVLGFWLVWDQRAQWITEVFIQWMKGPTAVTFLAGNIASATFSMFVIALFLHVFIPLGFVVLIFIHVLRLARARLVSPRYLMVLSAVGLAALALLLPARSAGPARMEIVIDSVRLDPWYLGFLVLLDRWGSLPVLALGGLLLGALLLLPWLARGKHPGPAFVAEARCTGCSLCSHECPYHAIEMLPRDAGDPGGYKRRALVNPGLCTGCGICVGTCATAGIELVNLPTQRVYQEGLLARVQNAVGEGLAPVVVFTCRRQAAAGSLDQSGLDSAADVLTCVLPCVGMVDPDWTKELFACGARDITFLACPYDDCANREGPHWTSARFKRRKGLLRPNLHWNEAAPGTARPLAELIENGQGRPQAAPVLPDTKARQKTWPRLPAAGLILFMLALLALPLDFSAGRSVAGQAQVRLVFEHAGIVKTGLDTSGLRLPEHASVDSAQIMGGERYPVALQVWVDGELALEERYQPTGWRKEGKISGLAELSLPAGRRHLEVKLQDDGERWRPVFIETLDIQSKQNLILLYNPIDDVFFQR